MDQTEDLSARVLLKHILTTDIPRTPITRSVTRRSTRSSRKDGLTPQNILRRSLKNKMRESISRKSLPPTTVSRKTPLPAQASLLLDDGDTPRHLLRNILQTEPVRSPVVHENGATEPQLPSANSSIISKRSSMELSGLELPDLTIGNAASTVKGLSRKRPRRSLNVTAFEKRFRDGEDVEDNESISGHSSLTSESLSCSSTSLSLKTPFVDVRTEKRGLQRKVSHRPKITEEEFEAAVEKRHLEGVGGLVLEEQVLCEATYVEGFTLGLTKLGEPDITADVIHCNTALYAQTDAAQSTFTMVATQDKPTVMASQLQRDMERLEQEGEEESAYMFPTEEGAEAEPQDKEGVSQTDREVGDAAESETCEMGKSQKEEEGAARSHSEEESDVEGCQSEQQDAAGTSQPEEEDHVSDSQGEDDVETMSQTEEEAEADESEQPDPTGGEADSQDGEDLEARSQTEEEEDHEECQSEQQDLAGTSQSEEEGGEADSQTESEHDGKRVDEHISRRARCSEGSGLLLLNEAERGLPDSTETGCSEGESHTDAEFHSGMAASSVPPVGVLDSTESSSQDLNQNDASGADRENSFHLQELSNDLGHDDQPNDVSPEAEAAPDSAGQEEEEWEDEDEEGEDVPMKTPAFVKQKRNFFLSEPATSPVLKIQPSDEGLPQAKTKPVRQRKTGPAKRETGLPKSYLMNVFKHFAKTKVSADVYPVLKEVMDRFFTRLASDLETYALHAKRKTIEVEDAVLLLRRQGYVNDKVPVEVLIEKYLRLDQRKLLIPIATSGNVVVPKKLR